MQTLGEIVDENDYEIVVPRTTKVWDRIDQFKKWDEYEFFNRLRTVPMYKKQQTLFWSQFMIQ